jgi:hypothetical protein
MEVQTYKYTTIWNAGKDANGISNLSPPQTASVRIIVGPTIKPAEITTLAKAASSVPRVRLVIVGPSNPAWLSLRLFKNLVGIQAYGLGETNLEELQYAPDDIRELELGIDDKPNLFVEPLRRFKSLTRLTLSGKLTDLDIVCFPKLTDLSLCYFPNLELKPLFEHKSLIALKIQHGSIITIPGPKLTSKLQKLNLWKVKGLDHLNWLGSLTSLRRLELGGLSNIQSLPELAKLKQLSYIQLDQLKSLSSLAPIAKLPALARLHVVGMNQIPMEDYLALANSSFLTEVSPGYSSKSKNEQVGRELGLPRVQYEPIYDITEF